MLYVIVIAVKVSKGRFSPSQSTWGGGLMEQIVHKEVSFAEMIFVPLKCIRNLQLFICILYTYFFL